MKKELIRICSALTDNTSVAEKYAEHLSELFAVVMPDMIGEEFKLALCEKRAADAVALLAKYYRAKPDPTVKELYSVGEYDLELCDKTSRGIMREVSVDWEFEGGEVDFLFDPTEIKRPINPEWLWQFNRHKYWSNMSRTYRATGNEKYAAAFKKQLLKWIAETYIPEVWNYPGSAWRTIECGIRLLGHWQVAFDGFRHSETVDDTTLLLMIASMHRQSTHLMAHPTKGNWLMMEMNGVYTFSGLFPELCVVPRFSK